MARSAASIDARTYVATATDEEVYRAFARALSRTCQGPPSTALRWWPLMGPRSRFLVSCTTYCFRWRRRFKPEWA